MNRITQLVVESDLIEWDILPSGCRTPNHESVVKAQKFALLIVRECVKEIEFQYGGGSDQPMDDEWDRAIERASSMVKHRFGVEE